jgi:hypothetical protein
MKQFNTFKSALNFLQKCPVCDEHLSINDKNLADYDIKKNLISFYIDVRDQDTVTVNLESDKIESINISAPYSKMYSGLFMHALNIDCKYCCQYSYILQVHINLQDMMMQQIYLNSEFINISDDIIHEVKNSYSTEQTIYTCFNKDGSSKTATLPLVPLDLKNPKETISRIRKLLIFS